MKWNFWGKNHNWIFREQYLSKFLDRLIASKKDNFWRMPSGFFCSIIKSKWYWLFVTTFKPSRKHQDLFSCYIQLQEWCFGLWDFNLLYCFCQAFSSWLIYCFLLKILYLKVSLQSVCNLLIVLISNSY